MRMDNVYGWSVEEDMHRFSVVLTKNDYHYRITSDRWIHAKKHSQAMYELVQEVEAAYLKYRQGNTTYPMWQSGIIGYATIDGTFAPEPSAIPFPADPSILSISKRKKLLLLISA